MTHSTTKRLQSIAIAALTAGLLATPAPSAKQKRQWEKLAMDGEQLKNWAFLGGAWRQEKDGTILPPGNAIDENLAFNTQAAYADFEARFDFRIDYAIVGCGFIFRAKDARHYYIGCSWVRMGGWGVVTPL